MTNANPPGTVSVIGIGNMGSALAEALLTAGFTVTVWNRTVSKAERMVEQGAILADSAAASALNSENTIVCVTDHAAFVSVIHNDSVATALEGKRLIQLGGCNCRASARNRCLGTGTKYWLPGRFDFWITD